MCKRSEDGNRCGLHNVYCDVGNGRLAPKQRGTKRG